MRRLFSLLRSCSPWYWVYRASRWTYRLVDRVYWSPDHDAPGRVEPPPGSVQARVEAMLGIVLAPFCAAFVALSLGLDVLAVSTWLVHQI